MKKIKLLSIVWLLSATAFAADYTGIQLTFQRTGTNASSVTVNVSDQDANPLDGVTATLESTSFGNLMTGTAQALTNGSVLAPANNSSYSNGANAEISYLFRIDGLDPSFTYYKADIDVYAMTKGGTAQGNGGDTKRYFNFSVSTGGTSNVSLFAQKTENTDICTVSDHNGGLYHSVQTMFASTEQTATAPLYVRVTLKKISSDGCYAGIGMVKLYGDPQEQSFSGDKFYTIRRFGANNAYMHDLGDKIGTSTLDTQKKCWWLLIPTANPNCYYVMNAASGNYIQSSKGLDQNVPVSMGSTPVEFQIKKDEKTGTTKGYYYMASTDQTISTDASSQTYGLNWSSAFSCVVTWFIRSGTNANSYWEIVESENGYDPPTTGYSTFTQSAQIYSIPCGVRVKGCAYLTNADFEGEDVLSELHYTSNSAPADHIVLYTEQKMDVKQNGTLPVSIAIANAKTSTKAFAFTDWNKDGVFDERSEIVNGTVNLSVPEDAKLGQYRLRIRVVEDDVDAETQATGISYDFLVNVVSADTDIEWSVKPNNAMRGTTSGELVEKDNKTYLKVSVKPIGDAVFKGWKLMHNYFQGEIVYTPANSTDFEHEFELTQSLHLVAVLDPNTKVSQDVTNAAYSTMYYSNIALEVPENVEAITYKVVDGVLSKSKTYAPNDIIPAGEPVVIYDNDRDDTKTYQFRIAITKVVPDPDNMLLGFDEDHITVGLDPSETYKFYKFSFKGRDSEGKPDNVGFYYGEKNGGAFTSGAHKAYLAVPQSAMGTGSAKEFLSMPEGNDVTGIQDVVTRNSDGAVYTLQGVKIIDKDCDGHRKNLPKGVYIINQRKEIIK